MVNILKQGQRSTKLLIKIIIYKIGDILVSLAFLFAILFSSSIFVYLAEHQAQPEVFSSLSDALWWGVATITTVGYGDIVPVTILGKITAGLVSIIGIGLFAIPSGIIAAGYIELDKKRCPHCRRRI